jgi:hypothetical protein
MSDKHSLMSDGDYIAGLNRDLMRERARAEDAEAEAGRLREALQDIADDLGNPGDPAWRRAMEVLGLDADAAERAWHD